MTMLYEIKCDDCGTFIRKGTRRESFEGARCDNCAMQQREAQQREARISAGRKALNLGYKTGELITFQHPATGETYAAIVTYERDGLLWAAGPLVADEDAQAFIDRQYSGDMVVVAGWMAGELTLNNAWGRIL